MLLILTNSDDATASHLEPSLTDSDVKWLRFDTDKSLCGSSVSFRNGRPQLTVGPYSLTPDKIDHVWYRRPERLKHEAIDDTPEGKFVYGEWAEALEGFLAHIDKKKWMNWPAANAAASHKIEQLSRAKQLGFQIPETLVTTSPIELKKFYDAQRGKIIAKPMAKGYVERFDEGNDSLIYTNRVFDEHLIELDDMSNCPTLFQQFVEKTADVRIAVVDQEVHPVALYASDSSGLQRCDIRINNMDDVKYEKIELPNVERTNILRIMNHYNLRFAAIDMALGKDGQWYFFEVNPNGQWAWIEEAGAANISDSFVKSFRGPSR